MFKINPAELLSVQALGVAVRLAQSEGAGVPFGVATSDSFGALEGPGQAQIGLTDVTAAFTVGKNAHGVTSGAHGVIAAASGSALSLTGLVGHFQVGEAIVDDNGTPGAATVASYDSHGTAYLDFNEKLAAFTVGKTVTGLTSGAHGVIVDMFDGGDFGELTIDGVVGQFLIGETIVDNNSMAGRAVAASVAYKLLILVPDAGAPAIEVGEKIVGVTSGAQATCCAVFSDTAIGLTLPSFSTPFQSGEILHAEPDIEAQIQCDGFSNADSLLFAAMLKTIKDHQPLCAEHTPMGSGADTTEDPLMTFVVPPGTLKVGDVLKFIAWGTGVNTADATTVKAYFGATVIASQVLKVSAANVWRIEADVIVTDVNAQVVNAIVFDNTALVTTPINSAPAEVLASPIVVKCTGQRGTSSVANSVQQLGMIMKRN